MSIRAYSDILPCIHDEASPIGRLGRGAHYSVFRTVQWKSTSGTPMEVGRLHDVAVIWDEDHDVRVVQALEMLHLRGLLWPIAFVGERKGMLTLLFSDQCADGGRTEDDRYATALERVAEDVDDRDPWSINVGVYHRATDQRPGTTNPASIIDADERIVIPYLQTIDSMWGLGPKT